MITLQDKPYAIRLERGENGQLQPQSRQLLGKWFTVHPHDAATANWLQRLPKKHRAAPSDETGTLVHSSQLDSYLLLQAYLRMPKPAPRTTPRAYGGKDAADTAAKVTKHSQAIRGNGRRLTPRDYERRFANGYAIEPAAEIKTAYS